MSNLGDAFNCKQVMIIASILLLALLRGGLYASYLPPWGLIDEQQHVHYIQYLGEDRSIPVVGETYLSPEIADSVFQTRRHEMFHWPPLHSPNPKDMGLEGQSYEGYQPPLFYLLFAPLFKILPSDILIKVYGLRWAIVGLSLFTVWITYQIGRDLFPQDYALPVVICFLLVMIPERTISVSRVNNDVLLELLATTFVWISTRSVLNGLSIRRAQLLGLFLGLGVLAKTSMAVMVIFLPFVFWANRRDSKLQHYVVWTATILTLLIFPLIARNLWLYGDITGFAGFRAISNFDRPELTWYTVVRAILALFPHFWMIWWKGSQVTRNLFTDCLYLVLLFLTGWSLINLVIHFRKQSVKPGSKKNLLVILMYMAAIGGYAAAILISYLAGNIPIVQGRLFLPVIAPIVILFGWGLWISRQRLVLFLITTSVLAIMDILFLFGNLLPYFYYWSIFARSGASPSSHFSKNWGETWNLFYPRFLSDKPAFLHSVIIWLVPLYIFVLPFTLLQLIKIFPTSNQTASLFETRPPD